jgi:hypothetical protein
MRSIAGWFVATMAIVGAARAADPLVPAPQGAPMLLEVAADGVQIYACEAKGQGFEWVFKAPEANLFNMQNLQVGTHFAGPTWKANDGSTVVGEVAARADAPASGAIPWLLLRAKSTQGSGVFSSVALIRRADTKGGVAPASGCDAAHVGTQARVRYYALYQFFGAAK